jgi:subtilase family serine protease
MSMNNILKLSVALTILVGSQLGRGQQINKMKGQIPSGAVSRSTDVQAFDGNIKSEKPLGLVPKLIHQHYKTSKYKHRGGKTIAVVVPYHYAAAESDLRYFSKQFKLHLCSSKKGCFQALSTTSVDAECAWPKEAALSLQWAHAMAPKAHLLLVEAKSNDAVDLFAAVRQASQRLKELGGGQMIMVWPLCSDTSCEFADEVNYDQYFAEDGIVYFAATGDSDNGPVVSYPSTSPNVVAVGGTLPGIGTDQESGWSYTNGGDSMFEPKPVFQKNIQNTSDTWRSTPDIATNALPVAVYYTSSCPSVPSGWQAGLGGTSAATPIAAGMANAAGFNNRSSLMELQNIYANRKNPNRIRDIIDAGSPANPCSEGYDKTTGVGAPLGRKFDRPRRGSTPPK